MTLTHPYALWLLVLLPIPLLLARRRPPARRIVVSNLYLWRNLDRREAARPTLRRVRLDWLVALQMAFIAAVIAALTHPTVALQSAHVAFVIDVSASMAANDGPVSRFDRARHLAQSALRALPRRAHVRVIAAGASARDLGDYVVSDPALTRILDTLVPTAGPSDLGSAVNLARIADATAAVHVFSDRPLKDVKDVTEASDGAGGVVSWETVGRAADNLAIVTVAARRHSLDPAGGQVLVDVRNYGAQSHDADIDVTQDGQPLRRETLHLAARGAQIVSVSTTRLGHIINARLLADDALAVDNQRWTVVPALERIRVGLGKDGGSFLQHALAVNPAIAVQSLVSLRAGAAVGTRGATAPPPEVVVCTDCGQWSESRGVLMIPARAGSSNASALTIAQPDHALAASLDLDGLFATPLPSRLAGAGDVIVRSGRFPAVIAYEHDGRRTVEFCFDVDGSDITLSPAFPILVANAVEWLAARNENRLEIGSGEPLRWTLPEAPAPNSVVVTGPDGRPRQAQVEGRRVTVADTERPGIYRVNTPQADQAFVVNAAVDSESDLIPSGPETTAPVRTNPTGYAPREFGIAPLLLLIASAFFAAEWWYRRGRTMWRMVIAACLALAASGLAVAPRQGHMDVIAVLDRSASMPVTAQARGIARVNELAATMRSGDQLGVVAFGADAIVERRPADRAPLPALASAVVETGTNIEAALRLGRALLPRGGSENQRRMVLISDGRETSGDAVKEAANAAAAGIRVDVVQPDLQGTHRELAVSRVVVPSDVRIDEPFLVSVEIEGNAGARGQVSVYRDDEPLGTADISISSSLSSSVSSSGTTNVAFPDREPHQGTHTYRALVKDLDDDFDQAARDTGSGAVVSVSGQPAVLYVSSANRSLGSVLAPAGFRVAPVSPESMPASATALRAYDAIVLDDVPAARLSTTQTSALAEYVERLGGGLLLLGSPRSLDLGGYPTRDLGGILPIDLRPRAGRRAPSLGLVLVFDKSGSMADLADGTPKIELARQGVRRVLDILPATDAVGVIAFDAEPVVVAPLTSPSDARAIADRLRTIAAGGATRIAPAVELALQWLKGPAGVTLSKRKILLVSDGRTSVDDAQRLRTAIANAGVELSVVAVGANADRDLLRQLAESTGGRAYFPTDVAELPLLVSREAARSRSGTVVEERFTLRGAPHPILGGISRGSLPPLSGYVVSTVKPTATSILTSHLDDPILAVWRAGLGRAAVFTADLGSPWSASLREWQSFARLWTQSVRWVSRRSDDQALGVAITEEDSGMHLSVEAADADGTFLNLANGRAIVRPPTGESWETPLAVSAPGHYDAHLHATSAGPYVIVVEGEDRESGAEHHVVRGFYWSADRERRVRGADPTLLRTLAETTGGRPLGPADSPFSDARPTEYVDISAWLVGAALALFLLDLLMRRGLVATSAGLHRRAA